MCGERLARVLEGAQGENRKISRFGGSPGKGRGFVCECVVVCQSGRRVYSCEYRFGFEERDLRCCRAWPCVPLSSVISRFTLYQRDTTDRGFGPFRAGGSLGSTLQVVCRRVSFRWAAPLRVVSNHARAKRAGTLAYSGVNPSHYLRPCTRGLPVSHLFVYVLRMHIHMSSLNLCQ